MSWSLYPHGEVDGNDVGLDDGWNYTHNCNGMIRAAGMDWSSEHLEGVTGKRLAIELAAAILVLETDPAKFIAMNPDNGWGSYETLLPVLRAIRDCAVKFPSSTWHASF